MTDDQKRHVCGIDGCQKRYGSASSLCAHKRTHHPNWRGRSTGGHPRKEEADLFAQFPYVDIQMEMTGVPSGTGVGTEVTEEDELLGALTKLGGGDGALGAATQAQMRELALQRLQARKSALSEPAVKWLELLAEDAKGRIGALQRSRARLGQGIKEEHEVIATAAAEVRARREAAPAGSRGAPSEAAAAAAAAAAAGALFGEMDHSIAAELSDLQEWLKKIESMRILSLPNVLDLVEDDTNDAEAAEAGTGAAPGAHQSGPADATAAATEGASGSGAGTDRLAAAEEAPAAEQHQPKRFRVTRAELAAASHVAAVTAAVFAGAAEHARTRGLSLASKGDAMAGVPVAQKRKAGAAIGSRSGTKTSHARTNPDASDAGALGPDGPSAAGAAVTVTPAG